MAQSFNLKDTGSLSWNAAGTKITGLAGGGLSVSAGTSIYFDTGGNDRMMIDNQGYVGIGTNEPSEKLEVAGSAKGDGAVIGNAKIGVWGYSVGEYAVFLHKNMQSTELTSYALIQKDDGNTHLNAASGQNLDFRINNSVKVKITYDGTFSVGSPDLINGIDTQILGEFSIQASAQKIVSAGTGATLWKYRHHKDASNNWFLFTQYKYLTSAWVGYNKGYVAESGGYTIMNFTGQHRNLMNTSIGTSQDGLIVSATNNIINMNNSIVPSTNESLPYCMITNTDNDKKVFGVISNKEDNEKEREYGSGNFVSVFEKENVNEERMFINSVGEGAIWVSNKNGTLEIGDYISSTSIPGYGGKQILNEEFLTRYTVAKMTCDCDFSLTKIVKQKLKVIQTSEGQELVYDSSGNPEYEDDLDPDGNIQMVYPYQTRFLQADGTLLVDQADYLARLNNGETVYIACFVGCTYHCG